MISGFSAMVAVAIWGGLVLIHGLYRSLLRPAPNPIRPAGPGGTA